PPGRPRRQRRAWRRPVHLERPALLLLPPRRAHRAVRLADLAGAEVTKGRADWVPPIVWEGRQPRCACAGATQELATEVAPTSRSHSRRPRLLGACDPASQPARHP